MNLYPKEYLNNVREIDINFLKENSIKGLILDVDNTLIDFYKKMPDGTKQWSDKLKENGIKLCILSNSNHKDKVEKVAKELEIPYLYFALKPFKFGFKKAIEKLQEKDSNIAVVGDQIFTDIIGANRCKLFSILVKPIEERDLFITKIKRPIENRIIRSYINKRENKDEK